MNITITINTDNDAFANDPSGEVSRILKRLIADIKTEWFLQLVGDSKLFDINGNTVGKVTIEY